MKEELIDQATQVLKDGWKGHSKRFDWLASFYSFQINSYGDVTVLENAVKEVIRIHREPSSMEQKESDMSLLVQNIVAAPRSEDAENVTDAAADKDDVAENAAEVVEDDAADDEIVENAAEVVEDAAEDEVDVAADSSDAVDNAEAAADAGVVDDVESSDVASSSSPFPRAIIASSFSPMTDGDESSLSSPDAVNRKRCHDIEVQQVLKRSTRQKGPRAVVPLIQAGDQLRNECRQANKADVLFELQSHKEMFYYCMRTWRVKIIGEDETSIVQDGYVYYYIHPFGRLGRLKRRATIAQIRSSTVGVDYFLHKDMEELLRIYHNLSSLTHPDSGSQVSSWAEYDTLCGGRDNAREYYYLRFPEQPQLA